MNTFNTIFGIDVSQANLDFVELSNDEEDFQQIPNTTLSILEWIDQLPAKDDVLCVIEPTGCYSYRLLHYLSHHGIAIKLVSPSQSHGFTQALGIISKDDRQAARALALMGKSLELPLYKHPDENMQRRKQLLMGINALKKQSQVLKNQLHALDNQIIFEPKVVQALKQILATVEGQLQTLEEELNDLSDEEHDQQFKLMTSIVGIGPKTAHLLLCATGGLQHFNHPKQLSKFVGVVPYSHQSGKSVRKKGRITKKGNSALSCLLYTSPSPRDRTRSRMPSSA